MRKAYKSFFKIIIIISLLSIILLPYVFSIAIENVIEENAIDNSVIDNSIIDNNVNENTSIKNEISTNTASENTIKGDNNVSNEGVDKSNSVVSESVKEENKYEADEIETTKSEGIAVFSENAEDDGTQKYYKRYAVSEISELEGCEFILSYENGIAKKVTNVSTSGNTRLQANGTYDYYNYSEHVCVGQNYEVWIFKNGYEYENGYKYQIYNQDSNCYLKIDGTTVSVTTDPTYLYVCISNDATHEGQITIQNDDAYYLNNYGAGEQNLFGGWNRLDANDYATLYKRDDVSNVNRQVLFNGKNGSGSYYSFAKSIYVDSQGSLENGKTKVRVPEVNEIITGSKPYNWTIAGWYDIIHNEYYDSSCFGKEITCYSDSIFYADYIADSYNFGTTKRDNIKATKALDDMMIKIFDYNDLFNIPSASYDGKSWKINDSKYGFVFHGLATSGDLANLTATPYSKYTNSNAVVQGILNTYPNLLNSLFNDSANTLGIHYIGSANNLFYLCDDGYYEYDSSKYMASYNQEEEKFYVYNEPQTIKHGSNYVNSFLPLNGEGESYNYSAKSANINYWFGLQFEVKFFYSSDELEGSQIFEFSGDDDVWVFVDDTLVLDLGGTHDAATRNT